MQQFRKNAVARALGQRPTLRQKQNTVRAVHRQSVREIVLALKAYIDSLYNSAPGAAPSRLPTLEELTILCHDQKWKIADIEHIAETYVKWYIPLYYKMVPTFAPRHHRDIGTMYTSGIPEITDQMVLEGKLYARGSTRFIPLSLWPRRITHEYFRRIQERMRIRMAPRGVKRKRGNNSNSSNNAPNKKRRKVSAPVGPGVTMYTSVRDFESRVKDSNVMRICMRGDQGVLRSYARDWIYSPPVRNRHSVWDDRTWRYFVADKNEGFAVCAMIDAEKFAGERILYLILICSTSSSRGVGTRIMRVVENEARRLRCGRVWLASLPERTAIYKKWGYHFGPYYDDTSSDPLTSLETGKRAARIVSGLPVPPATPLSKKNKNGKTSVPRPSILYFIRGLHDDAVSNEGYLMTKRIPSD
jgi:hypothetical protein